MCWDDFKKFDVPNCENWPKDIQLLFDEGLIQVEYINDIPYFSLTDKGRYIEKVYSLD